MREWLATSLALLMDSPLLQGVLAALATFVLEDPTTIGCGLLVAESKMGFFTALIGVSAGIAIGDIGLYAGGRLLGPRVVGRGPLTPARYRRATRWFERNLVLAVVVSRFVPGMRLPTYVGAGVLRAPFGRFVAVAVAASLVWTLLLLKLTVALGEQILPLLGNLRWPAVFVALLLVVLLQRKAAAILDRDDAPDSDRPLSTFELWPPVIFYIPVFFQWLWLALRYRSMTLPTAANPSIFSGGFIGESKSEILDLVSPEHAPLVAPWVRIKVANDQNTGQKVEESIAAMAARGIEFPVVAKPDVGQRGDGVRPIANSDELAEYLRAFPSGRGLILQDLVETSTPKVPVTSSSAPLSDAREAGILYWRRPDEDRGRLFSITLKLFPEVVGDGRRTIRQLIEEDPRAGRMRSTYLSRMGDQQDHILAEGQRRPLVFSGNHCQGTIFRDGADLATPELLSVIDEVARAMPGFFFGRFDIRFSDLEAMRRGEEFTIIEINGASGEATHIWDSRMRLGDAYATLFEQFRILFELGAANRALGHRPIGPVRFLREVIDYRHISRHYPSTE